MDIAETLPVAILIHPVGVRGVGISRIEVQHKLPLVIDRITITVFIWTAVYENPVLCVRLVAQLVSARPDVVEETIGAHSCEPLHIAVRSHTKQPRPVRR